MTNSFEETLQRGPEQPLGKRHRLIAAASKLLHQQGAEKTTLAEIAQCADVPAGNIYYYFKTKDDIIAAVIEAHVRQSKAALATIDSSHRSPKSRLKALVGEYARQSEVIALSGCPHGSLCSELDKRPGSSDLPLADLMRVPIEWAEEQFRALGRSDAHDLAVSLVAAYQGSALLANTFRDPNILAREARRLNRWIDTLG
jgi:AcrR family transcriptional regulator